MEAYLAETEFVHYLAEHGAPVADALPSVNGNRVERVGSAYASLFAYAKGMLLSDNGYRYRDGAPLTEYFFNTGKALGKIHHLSKTFSPVHRRQDYFDKYNMEYINSLLGNGRAPLKAAMEKRLVRSRQLPRTRDVYGLVHFDYSDGNYHIDMDTGDLTVFDFNNCMRCWYMFDLANLWTHGEGWCRGEDDPRRRTAIMKTYFENVLAGYRTQTDVSEAMLRHLPLFIDMVLIENIVDEFECCRRNGEAVDEEDIEDATRCLTEDIPYADLADMPGDFLLDNSVPKCDNK